MLPRKTRANLIAAGAGGLLLLTALVGLVPALAADPPVWPMLLFHPIVLGAGVFTLLAGLAVYRVSPGMTLATASGCAATAGFLAYVGGTNTLGPALLKPLLTLQLGLSGVIGLLAAWHVLGPDGRAWRRVLAGGGLLACGGVIAALSFLDVGRPIRAALADGGTFVAAAAGLVAFLAFLVATAAGVQLVVRPFEAALDARQGPKTPPPGQRGRKPAAVNPKESP